MRRRPSWHPFVRNKGELWLLHQVARTYSSRPSALLGIANDWLAYQVDVAAMSLGNQVESMTADGKLTAAEALERLGAEGRGDPARAGDGRRFRDARPMVTRTMRVPESGIW